MLGNWQNFLRMDENKTELFQFLSEHIQTMQIAESKKVFATMNKSVVSVGASNENEAGMKNCFHEEADTRIFIHVANAVTWGHKHSIRCWKGVSFCTSP